MASVRIKVREVDGGYEAVVDDAVIYPGASPDEALGHAVRETVLELGSTFGVVVTLREERPPVPEKPRQLILPEGYEREKAIEAFQWCYFAYQEMGAAISHAAAKPATRVLVYDPDGLRRREGLLCWVRDEWCGVLFDGATEAETHRLCDVDSIV